MTIFLRRELLVWPNADVEVCVPRVLYCHSPFVVCLPLPNCTTFEPSQFLVTFVISLMKSIDIRSESAVKLLAEFLDMETQYIAGERHVNAEHFAHGPSEFWATAALFAFWSHPSPNFCFLSIEIYCYLRSPYKDLGVYDSVVQVRTHCNRGDMCVHMADFRFAQKSMTPHRVSLLPLHTSAPRAAGNLVTGRNHHVLSHSIAGHRIHIHIHIVLRFKNGIFDPSAALRSSVKFRANSIQDQIAHTARLRFRMPHVVPVHTRASRARESDEPPRVHSVHPNPTEVTAMKQLDPPKFW